MIKVFPKLSYIILVLATCLSCDPREGDLPAWESQYLIPLVNADFGISDLTLQRELLLKEDSNGVLSFVYVSDYDEVQLSDYLNIPDQSVTFNLPGLPNQLDDFSFEAAFKPSDFGVTTGVSVFVSPISISKMSTGADVSNYFIEAVFESGLLDLSLNNGFPFEIQPGATIKILNQGDQSVVFNHVTTQAIPAKGSYTMSPSYDLSSIRLSGKLEVVVENIQSDGVDSGDIDPDDTFGITLSMRNLALISATMIMPPFDTPDLLVDIPFSLPYGARIKEINIGSGILEGVFQTDLSFPMEVQLNLNTVSRYGQSLVNTLDLSNKKTMTLDLENTKVDLTNGGQFESNVLSLSVSLSSPGSDVPVTINFKEPIAATVSTFSLYPISVFGYLGSYSTTLTGLLSLEFFDKIVSGGVAFESPSVSAYIRNEIGTEVSLIDNSDLFIKGSNKRLYPGQEVILNQALKDMVIQRPTFPGERMESILIMDGNNEPNFGNFLSLLPSEVSFSFPVQIGSPVVDMNQFAIDSSRLSGNVEVEFPLALQAADLTLTDTLDFDVVFDTEYAKIISGELNTHVTNYFPINLLMQVYFLDEELLVLDSLFVTSKLIEAGEINSDGKITEPGVKNFVIEFNEEKLEILTLSQYVTPVFTLNTTQQDHVKVYNDSRANLKINGDFVIHLKNE